MEQARKITEAEKTKLIQEGNNFTTYSESPGKLGKDMRRSNEPLHPPA